MRTPQTARQPQFFALMHDGYNTELHEAVPTQHFHPLTITPAMNADIAEAFLLVNMHRILTFIETSVN